MKKILLACAVVAALSTAALAEDKPDYEVQYWQEHMSNLIMQYKAQGCDALNKEYEASDAALKAAVKARQELSSSPTATAKGKKK